ncbi:MAG: DUF4175 domain-containing protein [Prevotella sp.]|nr:DUF4175 domain-containing protein [Prevotella sp.]
MKSIMKSIMTASLLLATLTASAQSEQDIEKQMGFQISVAIDHGVEVTKSLGQERDIQQEGKPLKWRCDIYSFTLPKKQRYLLEEMMEIMETAGRENPNCYGINSMSETKDGDRVGHERNLMVGEDPQHYVTIGKDYTNFININILDAADTTKTHRYAYALEWREAYKGKVDVRYIVTYARIPSATTTLTRPNWRFFYLDQPKVRKGGPVLFKGDARVEWDGKDYPVQSIDSLIRDAQQKAEDAMKRAEQKTKDAMKRAEQNTEDAKKRMEELRQRFQTDSVLVVWTDSQEHDTDPVTDVVIRLHQGQPVTADDLLCDDNILLVFSLLKQQFLAGQNTEFNAISVYTLCKRAREYGFFSSAISGFPDSKAELEQLKRDISMMKSKATDDTISNYLQMAIAELDKMK